MMASAKLLSRLRNKRIDYLRRNPLRETDLDKAVHVTDHGADPEASAHINVTGRTLQRALETLPEDQAVVILL